MKVSVAMTTYNGEKYIIDQLQSILNQTRLPDEVIICDDCSLDDTPLLVKEFIDKNSLTNWKFIINKTNKGWRKNFIDTIAMTTGDIIFCADQDDIWLNYKIEIMSRIMEQNEQVKYLSGKMITVDKNGKEIDSRLSVGNQSTGEVVKISFSKKFNNINFRGCTICVKRDLALKLVKLNFSRFGHDAQLCRLSNIFDGTYIIQLPVIRYRIHDNNTTGVSDFTINKNNGVIRMDNIKRNIEWLDAVIDNHDIYSSLNKKKIKILYKTRSFLYKRLHFLQTKNVIEYIKLLKYKNYYSNIMMYLGDFYYCFENNKLLGKIMSNLVSRFKR